MISSKGATESITCIASTGSTAALSARMQPSHSVRTIDSGIAGVLLSRFRALRYREFVRVTMPQGPEPVGTVLGIAVRTPSTPTVYCEMPPCPPFVT